MTCMQPSKLDWDWHNLLGARHSMTFPDPVHGESSSRNWKQEEKNPKTPIMNHAERCYPHWNKQLESLKTPQNSSLKSLDSETHDFIHLPAAWPMATGLFKAKPKPSLKSYHETGRLVGWDGWLVSEAERRPSLVVSISPWAWHQEMKDL